MLNSSENGHHYLVLREGKQTSDVSHRFFVNAFNGLRKFILFLADLLFLLVMDDEFCQMLFFFLSLFFHLFLLVGG